MMTEPITSPASSRLLRTAIWVAIGALICAAIVCVIWVLFTPDNDLVGRAFLTILLLAAFAGVAILDAHLAPRRPAWFALASMIVWVVLLLIGAFMIWMPEPAFSYGIGFERFFRFLVITLVLQLALLHVRLFTKAHERHSTSFTTIVTYVTIALVGLLALMLVIPLVLEEHVDFESIYWRLVVALAILAAVGTALVPLVNALTAPRRPAPAYRPPLGQGARVPGHGGAPGHPQHAAPPGHGNAQSPLAWPTFVDGFTPLPVMPDGSPDWNAYYTGYPTYPQHGYVQPQASRTVDPAAPPAPAGSAAGAAQGAGSAPSGSAQAGSAAGYEGFPPPPPLPPRS